MKAFYSFLVSIEILFLVTACISPHAVTHRSVRGWYQVKPSDTLYSIAWRYGLDYKMLARWNRVDINSTIYPGQRLLLVEPGVKHPATPASGETSQSSSIPPPSSSHQSTAEQPGSGPTASTGSGKNPDSWRWPTKGKLISTYSAKDLNRRGIDIAGQLGQSIWAVADGRVVYSGNGLAGYGNLIIIKHSETYLSAYAYSQQRLVKEGMNVKAGRVIAKMGKHKTRTARLHFQIRKNGKPVDPLKFLPKR